MCFFFGDSGLWLSSGSDWAILYCVLSPPLCCLHVSPLVGAGLVHRGRSIQFHFGFSIFFPPRFFCFLRHVPVENFCWLDRTNSHAVKSISFCCSVVPPPPWIKFPFPAPFSMTASSNAPSVPALFFRLTSRFVFADFRSLLFSRTAS